MRSAFLTEMGFRGKIPISHPNMRTEMAWMCTLNADHYNIHHYSEIKGYDAVFIIFPKAMVKLNAFGVEMTPPIGAEKDLSIYKSPIIEVLKQNNKKVCFVQEGPSDLFGDYDLDIQFHYYNILSECDIIFAHNKIDVSFYKGLFPEKNIHVIPTLMIAEGLPTKLVTNNSAMIGGNFCRWYNGFQSYMVARNFDCPIYVPSSHCKRNGEEQIPNLFHLPWTTWAEWINVLSTFQYAVHLMPTVAAGTFSLNCAYWGIPCIGNKKVDTQNYLFKDLSVDVEDLYTAQNRAQGLKENEIFYRNMSKESRELLVKSYYFNRTKWLDHMENAINGQ